MRGKDALLLAASLGAIAGLSLASDALRPPLVALAELGAREGQAVAAEALVTRAWPAGPGAQVLALADASGRALAFWASQEPVEGAWVRVEGAVERMRGQPELRAWALEVLAPADAPLSPAQAARLAPALRDRAIAVLGDLRWPPESSPELAGEGALLALRVPQPQGLAELAGERVLARGALRYDGSRAAYQLEAWEVRAG